MASHNTTNTTAFIEAQQVRCFVFNDAAQGHASPVGDDVCNDIGGNFISDLWFIRLKLFQFSNCFCQIVSYCSSRVCFI